jgi:hypothetical protein
MSDNPFDAGASEPSPFDGRTVDLGAVLSVGSLRALTNVHRFLGAGVVLFVAYIVSLCTCVGIFFTAPFLLFGSYAFLLSVADDEPRISAVWSGLDRDPGSIFLSGWGIVLLLALVISPTLAASFAVEMAVQEGAMPAWATQAVASGVGAIWGCLIAPLTYAPMFWADGRTGTLSSFGTAIEAFRGSWLQVAAINLLTQVLNAPGSLVAVWMQSKQEEVLRSPGSEEAVDTAITMLAAAGGVYLLLFVAGTLGGCWMATAYRQVVPREA